MSKDYKDQKRDFIIPVHVDKKIHEVVQAVQPFILLQKQLTRNLEPLNRLVKQIQDSFGPILEQQRQFIEFTKVIRKRKKAVKETMLKSGWWLTPSLMGVPATWIDQAVYNYRNGNKAAIINLFRKVFQKDNCKNLEIVVTNWKKNKFFLPWQKHLDEALEAHRNKKYTLSVPVLLLVAEGIATDFCKKNRVYKKNDKSRGGEKLKKAIRQHYAQTNNILLSYLNLIESVVDTTIYQKTDLIKKKLRTNILNRHAVLHGLKKNYGTMKISLQAFMLLDMFSELR
ncbi:MAG: hypothetical protein SCARUB_01872 [Candidatus Scalindua rubra]|uniref:Uncharacterized protein n=1 Tax=Candidatus Scalindua rubra TaxID=1872076 RepID=A0A1E3XBJ3_9BACT|nr:MAG: hypothetical protein SCARUB_01872 [Candidatus Scalindua rubra]